MLLSGSAWVHCLKVGPLTICSWGALPRLPWMWSHPEAYCPQGLGKHATFWAYRTAWVLAWGELLGWTVTPLGRPFVIRWMGGTWVPAPTKCDKKLPACLWALLGWHVGLPSRQRGSQFGFCLPLRWLVPPGLRWFCHVACGVTQPQRPPRSGHPWQLQSKWLFPPRWCMGGLGFFDGLDIGDLCFLDSCKAQGLCIQGNMGADGSGFFNGLYCLRLIPSKFHIQFPDGSPPMGIYGWLSGQQLF